MNTLHLFVWFRPLLLINMQFQEDENMNHFSSYHHHSPAIKPMLYPRKTVYGLVFCSSQARMHVCQEADI